MSNGTHTTGGSDHSSNFWLGVLIFAVLLLVLWRVNVGLLLSPLLAGLGTWGFFQLRK